MARQAELIKPRLEAYRGLWALMQDASPSQVREKGIELTPAKRKKLEENLRSGYLESGGNGIFLSAEARDLFVKAQHQLMGIARAGTSSTRYLP